ncbi:MAG TPA: alpha/beta hydrolase [Leptolyngbyaceae cyanobacterium M33_DOE_097]|uniref:Alpha/beta hydrolase n=1 Tax=Oscillatoriales cyanobacterium SpSt-418 TaxID=2282169 RepID=A0A7C3PKW9_9CYAN|nr:alpha/beta hydrolase [Leptolyngbyaceae cyanobacterium M33_DOE_097]
MVQLNHMEPRFVEKYVDSGSCTIAYQQGGTPNHKPPLLLIHGWAIGVKPDQEVLTRLAQHYCVIVPDLSGFARSKYTRSLTTYYSY